MAKNRENREFMLFQLQQLDKLKPLRGNSKRSNGSSTFSAMQAEIKEQLASASAPHRRFGAQRSGADRRSPRRNRQNRPLPFENDTEAPGIQQRLESLYVELKDIAATVEDFASGIEDDPVRLAKISKRMDDLYEAQKRFNVADNDALVSLHEELKGASDRTAAPTEPLRDLRRNCANIAGELKTKAARLSAIRGQSGRGSFLKCSPPRQCHSGSPT